MQRRRRAAAIVTVCIILVAGAVAAFTTHREHTAHAYAEEMRMEMVRAYRNAGTWRAIVEERALMDGGRYRTVRHEIAVDGSERYRVATIERDERGRDVVSETVRDGSAVRTSISTEGGGNRVLELQNAPPVLGAFADNILGQRVRELARTTGMRLVGKEVIRGREGLKFEVEPGRLVWIDEQSAIPLRERLIADDIITLEIDVVDFEVGAGSRLAESASSGPTARPDSVEDLGYRPTARDSAPSSVLGFAPRPVVPPSSWTLTTSGYVAHGIHTEGPGGLPTWMEKYETPDGPVLITQSRAPRHAPVSHASDGTEGPSVVTVDGRLIQYFEDDWRTHATTRVAGVLVSFEALLPAEQTLGMVRYVK